MTDDELKTRLRHSADVLRDMLYDDLAEGCSRTVQRIDALLAEQEEAKRDAERYRWLREAPPYSARWLRWRIEHWSGAWNPVQGSDMDTAIDAARKERT